MKGLKMRKAIALVTAGIFVMQMMLTGCGNKTESITDTEQSSTTATSTVVENPTKEFVQLSWYMRKPIDNMKDQELIEAEANKIIKEKINAEIKFNLIDSASWEDKMKLMSAAGEVYDIAFTSSWTNKLDMNVQRGAFLPLNELLDKYGKNIKEKVDQRAWTAATYDGKIMAIPSQSPFSQPTAFVFKKDLVEKYKFDYKSVKTLSDLEPYLETIKKSEPNLVPLLATANISPLADSGNFNEITLTKGIAFNEKTEKIELALEIPETVDGFRKINEYYKKGYIAKDAATKTDYTAEAKSGKYAVLKDMGGYTEDGSKSTSQCGFPTVEALYGYPLINTGAMVGACSAISNTSENPERAMMLLDLVWSDKTLLNTMAFGLEGNNYTVKEGKGTDNPVIEAKSGAEQTWAIWHNWLGPLWDSWDSNWNSTKALELMKSDNDKAKTATTLGFLFNSEPVTAEVAQISAVYAEIQPVLRAGAAPDFDKYIAEAIQKLKDAGIDKVKAEVEKQYNEWKAKQ